ncbi:hypothetical protein Cgig2_015817 [Carnegiea gigantea]|uniref:Endonuclease/exonuclease/phosphatase domain-containing protein n=1 Tax=Carnegiea gigantea TaxID=171969 RepID=A0A9Q1KFK3_9CARY|nr:hypothetical protein Cgig2_015817 [Carnegiea gigantea]
MLHARASIGLGTRPAAQPRDSPSLRGSPSFNSMNSTHVGSNQEVRLLNWNTQGAGSRNFLNILKEHIRMQHPQIIMLLETHISGSRAETVCNNIEFRGRLLMEARGYQGRIWILWQDSAIQLDILEDHEQFVTVEVLSGGIRQWFFTAVYANPHPSNQEELWNRLDSWASRIR